MKLKKIISIILLSVMTMLLLSTTTMAVTYNKYYLAYNYSGKGKEMKYVVKGTETKVSTKATNPTSYSRYVEVGVTKRKRGSGKYISGKCDSNSGKKMYANTSMKRVLSDSSIYYVHQAILKPSSTSGYVIDSINYEIYQLPTY